MGAELLVKKHYTLKIFDNAMVELNVLDATVPDDAFIEDVFTTLVRNSRHGEWYILACGAPFLMVPHSAIPAMAEPYLRRVKALAVYSHNISPSEIRETRDAINAPMPVGIFNHKDDALEWLALQMQRQ